LAYRVIFHHDQSTKSNHGEIIDLPNGVVREALRKDFAKKML
jgi:hypothetical protein